MNGTSKIGEGWRGYYLTAYGIAVKHGFVGTEEEWLASLKGEPGAKAQVRFNSETNALEWKTAEDEAWAQLMSLSDLQTELEAATIAEAQAAANTASEASRDASESAVNAQGAEKRVLLAEKAIFNNIEKYGSVVNNAYVLGDTLYITTNKGKTFAAGNVRGEKGDTGDSGVHFGTEAPTDPEKVVWIDPTGQDGMREVVNILSRLKYTAGGVQVDLSDYAKEKDLKTYAKGVDWAENDANATNFVKNRTHYTARRDTLDRDDVSEIWLYREDGSIFLRDYIEWPDGLIEKVVWSDYYEDPKDSRFYDKYFYSVRGTFHEYGESNTVFCNFSADVKNYEWIYTGSTLIKDAIEVVHMLDKKFIPDYISKTEAEARYRDVYVIAPGNAENTDGADLILDGDPETDPEKINTFLQGLGDKGGRVMFLPGDVLVMCGISVPANVTIEGYNTVFKAELQYLFLLNGPGAELKNICAQSPTRDANSVNVGQTLVEVNSPGTRISGCDLYTFWGTCIKVNQTSGNHGKVSIENNVLEGLWPLDLAGSATVSGNTIKGTDYETPVKVSGTNCTLTGNLIYSYTEKDTIMGIKGIEISGNNNLCTGNRAPAITDEGTDNVVSGNVTVSA